MGGIPFYSGDEGEENLGKLLFDNTLLLRPWLRVRVRQVVISVSSLTRALPPPPPPPPPTRPEMEREKKTREDHFYFISFFGKQVGVLFVSAMPPCPPPLLRRHNSFPLGPPPRSSMSLSVACSSCGAFPILFSSPLFPLFRLLLLLRCLHRKSKRNQRMWRGKGEESDFCFPCAARYPPLFPIVFRASRRIFYAVAGNEATTNTFHFQIDSLIRGDTCRNSKCIFS